MLASASPEGIVAHMNKSHKLALEDFLYAYGDVKITDKIANVRLEKIELTHMTLSFNHFEVEFEIEKVVLFDPPLKEWSEARPRLVEMAKVAATKRGFSHVQINEISPPSGLGGYAFIALVFFPLACYYNRSLLNYVPVVGPYFDNGALLVVVEIAAFAIHVAECVYILKPRLDFYRVPTDFLIEWYFFGLLEGYPAVKRFDKLAKEKTLRSS
ncbi:LAME_0H10594g1_1 [Lachancea meyersii CBS 8951]|uniref:LAME_0H10594g1_1 n=1 Tax=Lachancea meyersii CBS 8951 TaxID=1266667 RepID=A0A1G4KFX1_9SACH|nr:LAME_0H10594g1_1 [Lachancea meyersii CBS 8951]